VVYEKRGSGKLTDAPTRTIRSGPDMSFVKAVVGSCWSKVMVTFKSCTQYRRSGVVFKRDVCTTDVYRNGRSWQHGARELENILNSSRDRITSGFITVTDQAFCSGWSSKYRLLSVNPVKETTLSALTPVPNWKR